MDKIGRHLVVDAFGCQEAILNDADTLERCLTALIRDLGMQVLHTHFHSFHPQGVTGIIVISTSHLSIHTWPEHKYAAIDIYTCGNTELLSQAEEKLLSYLSAERVVAYEIPRGNESNTMPIVRTIQGNRSETSTSQEKPCKLQNQKKRGDYLDLIELREILAGPHRVVYKGASQYQDILIVEACERRMYLDQQLQFSTLDERIYHEALVHPALTLTPARKRVLVLGGGDGFALREILKYPDVCHVDLVDLDPLVLQLAKDMPEIVALNERSLHDQRVHIHALDAQQFITQQCSPYNVIIVDLPDPADKEISRLYTKEFFKRLSKHLASDGILVCQSHSPEYAPVVFWSICRTLKKAGLKTLSYHTEVPTFGDWGFHLVGHVPLKWKRNKVTVPHRTLPEDLTSWFQFEDDILYEKKYAVVNKLDHLTLHKVYQKEMGVK